MDGGALRERAKAKPIETHIGLYRYLAYELLNKHSIPMIIDVTAKSLEEFGEFNRHPGEEILYVIEGELDLVYQHVFAGELKERRFHVL